MDLNIFLKGLDREFRTPWRIKMIKRIKRIKSFNPFNPFNPPKGSGGLKGLNGFKYISQGLGPGIPDPLED